MPVQSIEVTSSDGRLITADVTGEGPPLVLLHGSLASADYWREVLHTLARSFTVYAVERRGRGRSPSGGAHTLDLERDDTLAVLEQINVPVHLVGHSWGAVVALRAAQATDRIDRLVLYEPPLPLMAPLVPDEAALTEARERCAAGDRQDALRAAFRSVGFPPDAYPEADIGDSPISWPRMVQVVDSWLPELDECVRLSPDPADWVVPQQTLLLVGTDNPQRTMQRLLCPQPAMLMWSLPGQGHEAPLTAPELFATEVIRFLSG
jgi:pimeloyl-ACP methyl ester carboxylesterase